MNCFTIHVRRDECRYTVHTTWSTRPNTIWYSQFDGCVRNALLYSEWIYAWVTHTHSHDIVISVVCTISTCFHDARQWSYTNRKWTGCAALRTAANVSNRTKTFDGSKNRNASTLSHLRRRRGEEDGFRFFSSSYFMLTSCPSGANE